MDLNYEQRENLPRLAWCARIVKDDDKVVVAHGPWVEVQDSFFCEGAWNGEFAKGKPDQATVFMGSGASIHKGGIIFSTPTHFLEKLYLLEHPNETLVSNSLAFVLAESGDSCDPNYLDYVYDLIDFHSKGFECRSTTLPTARGNKVHLYQACNLHIAKDMKPVATPKNSVSPPSNFSDYKILLQSCTKDLCKNALSDLRKVTYPPMATVSSGYDSTACAALAKEVGCKEAATLVKARRTKEWGENLDDSGKEIAEALGLDVSEYDRNSYLKSEDYPEAEFCACGTGEDINLLAMEQSFSGKMVFTGARGDFVWERLGFTVPWWSVVSFGITEFRLRVGYIHMALCAIGEEYRDNLVEISNSTEMNPWSICEFYDRPIARRIAEEAGIPRSFFGQEKKATSQSPIWGGQRMTENSNINFQRFSKKVYQERTKIQHCKFAFGHLILRLNNRANKIAFRFRDKLGLDFKPFRLVSQRYQKAPSAEDLSFAWGQNMIADRYQQSKET